MESYNTIYEFQEREVAGDARPRGKSARPRVVRRQHHAGDFGRVSFLADHVHNGTVPSMIYFLYMSTAVVKMEPKSEGIATPRKKRPKELAVITECCTGCAGSPACVPYCPVADCMYWVPDEDHAPFGHIEVDPVLCIGCKKCTSKGPDGAFLDGCPWDAIEMVPIEQVESQLGIKMVN